MCMSASVLMSVCICNNSVSLFQCIYCLIKLDYRRLVNMRHILCWNTLRKLFCEFARKCVYSYACVCAALSVTIIIQWQMFTTGIVQNSKCSPAWHANSPATRLPWTVRKEGWIEQGKMGEIMHQGSNGKKEEERDAIRVHVCARTTEKKRDRTRQVKTGPWNGGLRLSLRYSYVWERPGGSSWQFLSVYLCAWVGDAERKRKRADVCAYRSRAGRTSLYDSAAPVITD